MHLVYTVLHLGKCGMEVVTEHEEGRRRHCNVTWHRKQRSDVPPKNWSEQVFMELQFQDSDNTPPFMR